MKTENNLLYKEYEKYVNAGSKKPPITVGNLKVIIVIPQVSRANSQNLLLGESAIQEKIIKEVRLPRKVLGFDNKLVQDYPILKEENVHLLLDVTSNFTQFERFQFGALEFWAVPIRSIIGFVSEKDVSLFSESYREIKL